MRSTPKGSQIPSPCFVPQQVRLRGSARRNRPRHLHESCASLGATLLFLCEARSSTPQHEPLREYNRVQGGSRHVLHRRAADSEPPLAVLEQCCPDHARMPPDLYL